MNNDGDMGDRILEYYDINTGRLVNTGIDPGKLWSSLISISNNIIAILSYEGSNFWILRYYDIFTDKLINTGINMGRSSFISISNNIIAFSTFEDYLKEDLNNDGDMGDFILRYYDISTGNLVNTGLTVGREGSEGISVSNNIISFSVYEGDIGKDLNNDGDTYDDIIRYITLSKENIEEPQNIYCTFSECSERKPHYCDNGIMIDNCTLCGCPFNQSCNSTSNSCYYDVVPKCSDETLYRNCSSTKPLYCSNGTLINNCTLCGCPSGQNCLTNQSCMPSVNITCTDSNGGGELQTSYYVKGNATGNLFLGCDVGLNQTVGNYQDYCYDSSYVMEYYCDNSSRPGCSSLGGKNYVSLISAFCGNGCKDGACINIPCSDGTLYGQCSLTKSLYCSKNGTFINNCLYCGCPTNQSCQADGSCIIPVPKPDLIITNITMTPENPKVGEEITFYSTIKNIGDVETYSFGVCDYIDGRKTNCNSYYRSLKPSTTMGISWSRTPNWPSEFVAGEHTFKVESGNNSLTIIFTVLPNIITISNFSDGSTEKNITFNETTQNQTIYVQVPLDVNITNATIDVTSNLTKASLDVGNDGDIQFTINETNKTETTPDLSPEINEYITNNNNQSQDQTSNITGEVIYANSGHILVPLTFHSDSAGTIKISNININYITKQSLIEESSFLGKMGNSFILVVILGTIILIAYLYRIKRKER